MALFEKAFWGISFFLGGVLIESVVGRTQHPIAIALCICALVVVIFFIFGKPGMGWLALATVAGALYLFYFNQFQANRFSAPLDQQIEITGVVQRVSRSDQSQRIDLSIYKGRIRIYAREYPTVAYGDKLKVLGSLQSISAEANANSRGYFLKENIGATMSFPKSVEIIARNQGSKIKAWLYGIRDSVEASFRKALPPEPATLMTGLILGKSGGFSKDFNEKLKLTGTTHLVALSGQNISIIIKALEALLGIFLSRRFTVYGVMLAVLGFVVMTGAEASVVRAALMAGIVVLAERSSRIHSARSAIAITAFVMILFNPNILAFDVGFQLSFLALIGIIYLQPWLTKFLRVSVAPGFLNWRENLWMTISAQLAVLPILIMNFGYVSPLGVITNLLLVPLIPYTMFFGFAIFALAGVSNSLALVAVIPAQIMLGYELWVINICARVASLLRFS